MTFFFYPIPILLRNPNNTTSRSPARIPSYFALFMSTLPQIIRTAMYHDSPSEHTLWADELDEGVGQGAFGVALFVGFEVAEVADVALGVGGGTVLFAEGVDCEEERGLDLKFVCVEGGGRGRVWRGWWLVTYSEDQRLCSHLCCRRIDGRAYHARRRGRCRGCRRRWWWGMIRRLVRRSPHR